MRMTNLARRVRAGAIATSFGIAFIAMAAGAFGVHAHDVKHRIVPADRPELSFGRSADYDYDPPKPGTYRLPPIMEAADGQALNTKGEPVSLRALMKDRITVLAFIYTRCSDPQGCPLALGLLYDLQTISRADPVIGENLRLLAMSFDVEHDTPEVMAKYGAGEPADGKGTDLVFLSAQSKESLAPLLKAYNQPIARKTDPDDAYGPWVHQLRVYLIDRQGRVRNIYSLGFLDPRLVITDVRTLLLEERGQGPEG
jgi:cytochrome oxidase Cu insertion factor (SCO1/SenC/PrrC family)